MPKNAPLAAVENDVDDDLKMDDEYTPDETPANRPSGINLREVGFDDLRDEIEKRKMTMPAGDWIKSESWDLSEEKNTSVYEGDCEVGDINPEGRTMYMLYGYPDTREDKESNEFTPFLRYRLSPDRRAHKTKEGQNDLAYKMFVFAKDLFVAINGRKAKSQWELLECLANESYALNTMNGDDGLFVLRVKPLKKQR